MNSHAAIFAKHELLQRFDVKRELGSGAVSRVFEVWDHLHNIERALKLARGAGYARRFSYEFKHLAEFRHPNIVRAYDFGTTARGFPYYSMELVRGVPLSSLADAKNPETLALVAMQTLDALAVLHARGFVHRDITPENILVAGMGAGVLVRIIDLGLMVPTGQALPPAGTVNYVAPEAARGESLDGRADLYSLGAVLYAMALPEQPALDLQGVSERLREKPEPADQVNPLVPKGLSAFISKLLEPNPEKRFANCEEAARFLANIPALRVGRGPARVMAERLLRGGAVSHRQKAMQDVLHCARQVKDHSSGVSVMVRGAVGVGKTPFLRELAVALNLRGYRVMQVRVGIQSASPIREIISRAHAVHARRANSIFRVKSYISVDSSGFNIEDMFTNIGQFALRTGKFIGNALKSTPTALLIEDIDRAEPAALEVLRAWSQALHAWPLLLCFSVDSKADLGMATLAEVQVVDLKPLTPRQIQGLIAHRLKGLALPVPALSRLASDSQGMPSLVERTLARMLSDGTIQSSPKGFVFMGGRYRAASHADVEILLSQLGQLEEHHRQVLWAASVLHHRIDAQRLAKMASIDATSVDKILAELARIDVLRPGEIGSVLTYRFTSRALAMRIYQDIPKAERQRLHDRAATLLGWHRTEAGRDGRHEERAEHLLRGSSQSAAIDAALEAGDRARCAYADKRAIEYYARAYARIENVADPRASVLALKLGQTFHDTGELERGSSWYELAARSTSKNVQIQAVLGLGYSALERGALHLAWRQVELSLELVRSSELVAHEAVAKRLWALALLQRGEVASSRQVLREVAGLAKKRGDPSTACSVVLDLAELALDLGQNKKAARLIRRALVRARALQQPKINVRAEQLWATLMAQAGRHQRAIAILSRTRRAALVQGDQLAEAKIILRYAAVKVKQGALTRAHAAFVQSLDRLRLLGGRFHALVALHGLGFVCARLGDFRGALAAFRAHVELAEQLGQSHHASNSRHELAALWLNLGHGPNAQAAIGQGSYSAALGIAKHEDELAHWLAAWVNLRLGNSTHAENRLRSVAAGATKPSGQALAYAALCALSLQLTDLALLLSRRLLRACLDANDRVLVAVALGLRGRALIASEKISTGLRSVQQAARLSHHMGMRLWHAECQHTLWTLQPGTEAGVLAITLAMDELRHIACTLPGDFLDHWLANPMVLRIKEDFHLERQRVLNELHVR